MALNEPRPKKNCKLNPNQPLPILYNKQGTIYKFKGTFDGFSIVIDDEEDMKKIISMGYFGKATLSKNYPQMRRNRVEILRKRVFQSRKRHPKSHQKDFQKVVIVPDSDAESEDLTQYFTNLKPEFQIDHSGIKETVNLSLEEAFFLVNAIKCLDVQHKGEILVPHKIWDLFKENDQYFIQNYLVYYYYRSRNWVVKPGIKFGGDFLLYKQGPPFYHASYVVIINVVDENLKAIDNLKRRSMEHTSLLGLNRLCETAGKELLICEIVWPSTFEGEVADSDLYKFSIKETIMKRWISSQERNN